MMGNVMVKRTGSAVGIFRTKDAVSTVVSTRYAQTVKADARCSFNVDIGNRLTARSRRAESDYLHWKDFRYCRVVRPGRGDGRGDGVANY